MMRYFVQLGLKFPMGLGCQAGFCKGYLEIRPQTDQHSSGGSSASSARLLQETHPQLHCPREVTLSKAYLQPVKPLWLFCLGRTTSCQFCLLPLCATQPHS